jgi:dolichol-phosphate mannosyltransferase
MKESISIICPTFNEADNIPGLIKELQQILHGRDYEVIIVDDDSPDETWSVAEAIGRFDSRVRVLRRERKPGLGWSVIDGFEAARGDLIACMDADLQHDPAILPRMIDALHQGSDLVVGSRYAPGGSTGEWHHARKAGSWLATKLAQMFAGISISDPMSGFFALRRQHFLSICQRLDGKGFKILLEIASGMRGAHISEVPYTFRKRQAGESKLSWTVVFAYLAQLRRLHVRRRAPSLFPVSGSSGIS